jgi:hemoglobin/transferrin/lactoferrin receptor protein
MCSLAQTIVVKERISNMPIPGVMIYNFNKDKSIITDNTGLAKIDAFDKDETLYFQNFLYKQLRLKKSDIPEANFTVYMDLVTEGLDQVVISASKFKQSKRDVPQTIIGLSAKAIALNNPQTSADALEATGNVFIQKSQLGGGSPIIRGFSTNRLLITIDGVRMNNAIFRGGNLENVIAIDPFTIENTEVTLGAGSVVYGSDAIGGVMSFYTKKPQLSYKDKLFLKVNTVARYSSANNEKTTHADFNLGYKKWGFLSSVSYTDFEDLRMGSNGPNDYLRTQFVQTINGEDTLVNNPNPLIQQSTGYNQINLMQKVRYEPKDNLTYDFGLYYSATSTFGRYDRLLRPRGEGLRSAEWNYGPQKWLMSNLTLTKLSGNSSFYNKIQTTIAYQNFKERRIDRDFGSEIRRTRTESVDALSFNADLEKQINSKTSLFYGIEYLYNFINSEGFETNINTNENDVLSTRYPDNSSWQSIAAYTSLKYKPSSTFVFQTGLRYNQIIAHADFTANNTFFNLPFNTTSVNDGALTGTAGLRWMPNQIIEWNFNTSTAFRAPNIDDIGKVFDSEPGAVVVPNNGLKAEYAYGAELGLKLNFNNKVRLDLATYYTFLDNALVRRDFTLNGENQILYDGELSNVQAIQNASKEYIYGFEIGAEINFTRYLKLRSQYNIIGGVEEINNTEFPVRHVTPNFGRTHLIWNHKQFVFDVFGVYNDTLRFQDFAPSEISKDYIFAQDENGNPFSPSWYTLNFRAQYQVNTQFSTTVSLENITDQRYRPYSSGISAPGRNVIIALRYSL